MRPPSTELRARRSGFHARMFPPNFSISSNILLNNGRPIYFADCFSTTSAEMIISSRLAYSRNSVSWASILNTCLSSTSVDLRAYKKNFLFSILFIIVLKILFVFRAKKMQSKLLLISNLLLGEKSVHASAPKILNSFGKMGVNQWDALRASHLLALKKPLSSVLVCLLYQARTYFQNR